MREIHTWASTVFRYLYYNILLDSGRVYMLMLKKMIKQHTNKTPFCIITTFTLTTYQATDLMLMLIVSSLISIACLWHFTYFCTNVAFI